MTDFADLATSAVLEEVVEVMAPVATNPHGALVPGNQSIAPLSSTVVCGQLGHGEQAAGGRHAAW